MLRIDRIDFPSSDPEHTAAGSILSARAIAIELEPTIFAQPGVGVDQRVVRRRDTGENVDASHHCQVVRRIRGSCDPAGIGGHIVRTARHTLRVRPRRRVHASARQAHERARRLLVNDTCCHALGLTTLHVGKAVRCREDRVTIQQDARAFVVPTRTLSHECDHADAGDARTPGHRVGIDPDLIARNLRLRIVDITPAAGECEGYSTDQRAKMGMASRW